MLSWDNTGLQQPPPQLPTAVGPDISVSPSLSPSLTCILHLFVGPPECGCPTYNLSSTSCKSFSDTMPSIFFLSNAYILSLSLHTPPFSSPPPSPSSCPSPPHTPSHSLPWTLLYELGSLKASLKVPPFRGSPHKIAPGVSTCPVLLPKGSLVFRAAHDCEHLGFCSGPMAVSVGPAGSPQFPDGSSCLSCLCTHWLGSCSDSRGPKLACFCLQLLAAETWSLQEQPSCQPRLFSRPNTTDTPDLREPLGRGLWAGNGAHSLCREQWLHLKILGVQLGQPSEFTVKRPNMPGGADKLVLSLRALPVPATHLCGPCVSTRGHQTSLGLLDVF